MNTILKDRRFLLIVMANFVSSVGSGVTTIGASWLLVNKPNGEEVLGITMLGTTIILFLINPYVGVVVDRFSRKKMYLFNQVLGFSIIGTTTMVGVLSGHYDTWQLVIFIFSFSFYYMFHFPTLMAMVQEIFPPHLYRSLNGILEVESQSASAVAGGLAGVLLGTIHYDFIFLFDTLSFVLAFLCICFIPYKKRYKKKHHEDSFLSDIQEGLQFLKGKTFLIVLLSSTLVPFICVTLYNYVEPIYITDILNGSAKVFGISSMNYAIGAVVAGLLIPMMGGKIGYFKTVMIMMGGFAIFLIMVAGFQIVWIYLTVAVLEGFGNAGTRIMRKTIMMEIVPNEVIGRVNSFFKGLELLIRIVFLSSFIYLVSGMGPIVPVLIMIGMMIVALIGTGINKRYIRSAEKRETARVSTSKASS